MSSRGTIILTDDNEHWYDETNRNPFSVCIEIDMKNVIEFDHDKDDIFIEIKGDCQLARLIRKIKDIKDDEPFNLKQEDYTIQ